MEDSKLEKIKKILGDDTMGELEAMTQDELKTRVIQAEQSIQQAKEELEENPNFISAKAIMDDLRGGFNDVKKRQRAVIDYGLELMNSHGEVVAETNENPPQE